MRIKRFWTACAAVFVLVTPGASISPTSSPQQQGASTPGSILESEVLDHMLDALKIMQSEYFEPWIGTWPKAIDWTAAVMGSHVSGALESISRGLQARRDAEAEEYKARENLITLYFSQILGYYFGQDAFAIRQEAFDDMLWVVLGWLDTIQFVDFHTDLYYPPCEMSCGAAVESSETMPVILQNQTWHGNIWTPAFAHRARIFWELASRGWNTTLCGGGMNWNPRLEPYKNAITNELFIAASVSMYLYFPGDTNSAPYSEPDKPGTKANLHHGHPGKPHDPTYLVYALDGYSWLISSNMINENGLFIDGFHISGWRNKSDLNPQCDVRNEEVYTYNQGVILSGQLGLWKATGLWSFVEDGHRLIRHVIASTGYDLAANAPLDQLSALRPGQLPPWHGIGRAGIIEERCDVTGQCSQDSQTFKGIFFHHLTTFCSPPRGLFGDMAAEVGTAELERARTAHSIACGEYAGWVEHNARAAALTRDPSGQFGMWWTAGLLNLTWAPADMRSNWVTPEGSGVDYRTYGVPDDSTWVPFRRGHHDSDGPTRRAPRDDNLGPGPGQIPLRGPVRETGSGKTSPSPANGPVNPAWYRDPNNRGRGRTVETQGSGLAVLRAYWELSNPGYP